MGKKEQNPEINIDTVIAVVEAAELAGRKTGSQFEALKSQNPNEETVIFMERQPEKPLMRSSDGSLTPIPSSLRGLYNQLAQRETIRNIKDVLESKPNE